MRRSNHAAMADNRLKVSAAALSTALLVSLLFSGVVQATWTIPPSPPTSAGPTFGAYDENGNELNVALSDIFGSDGGVEYKGSIGLRSHIWINGPDDVADLGFGPHPVELFTGDDDDTCSLEPQEYWYTVEPQPFDCWLIGFDASTSGPGPWGAVVPIVARTPANTPLVFDRWETTGALVDGHCSTGEVGTPEAYGSVLSNQLPGPNGDPVAGVGFKGWVDVETGLGIYTANAIYAPLVPDTSAPIVTIQSPRDCLVVEAGSSVPVSYTCIDPGASDANPDCVAENGGFLDTSIVGEHTFSVTGTDESGNARTRTIHYIVAGDLTAPDTTVDSGPPDPSAGGSQAFTFSGTDNVAVAGFECAVDGGAFVGCTSPHAELVTISGAHTLEVRAFDGDGNFDDTPASYSWVVDATPPETFLQGAANFTDPSPSGSATFDVGGSDDDGSGVETVECQLDSAPFEPCQFEQLVFVSVHGLADGAHTFRARAIDAVGNVDATPAEIVWTVDTVAPVITISSPTATTYPLGASVGADYGCADGGSGLASCVGPVIDGQPIDTASIGEHTFTVTATDDAGNSSSTSVSYVVESGTQFVGFDQPVDMTGMNMAKAGKTIPLKWRLVDASGNPITTLAGVKVNATSFSCSAGTSPDQIEEYASGGSGLQNLGSGYYQFNWSTPKSYANSCKTVHLDLGDGSDHKADFKFTK